MIVFIAPFPALSDEKDGMVQRIASIDALVSDLPRVYLEISFRRFWFKRVHHFGKATVLQLNGLLHFFLILSWLQNGRVVYIHSVYNSMRVLPAYWLVKPITDLHGAVPEELAHQGKSWLAHLFGLVESIVLRRRAPAVHVTAAMKRHFQQKYQRQSTADRTIAILPRLSDVRGQRENVMGSTRDAKAVIYAGGLQAWQNVSMMLEAAAAATQLRYEFLSGEAPTLQRLADSAHVVNYTCISVPPDQVPDHYLTCTYGFVLRDPVLLNQVACPTKLVEYLYWGVIPIVLTPEIGDFAELGFAFISLENFRSGRLPDDNEAARMRAINRQVVEKLIQACEAELSTLRQVLRHG
jgi:hypothetical protein